MRPRGGKGLAQRHTAGQPWSKASTTEPASGSLSIHPPTSCQSLHPNSNVSWSLCFPHRKAERSSSFSQGPGGARPGSEWKWEHFLADAPMPLGCRARVPPHTYFWPTHSPSPGPPASAQSQLLGSGRQCGGPPKLGAGFHSTFHPVLPTGCRFPKGSSFSICLPTVCPRPGITVIVRLEKHLLCTPLTDQHNFRDEWDYRSHFTDEETGTRELARLPGLELPAGFSQRETQAGHRAG